MSYCRFIEGDVYAYVCDGGVQFYVSDGRRELDRLCNTFSDAYQYARALRDIYELDVPRYAIEALKADAIEEAARICGAGSAVAELLAENAKLQASNEVIAEDHAALCEQNAKLRELVLLMHRYIAESCAVQYPYPSKPVSYLSQLEVEKRMRDLGIEVDGD